LRVKTKCEKVRMAQLCNLWRLLLRVRVNDFDEARWRLRTSQQVS
jgi:hypothetical protein